MLQHQSGLQLLTKTNGVDSNTMTLEDAFAVHEERDAVASGDLNVGSGKQPSPEGAGKEPELAWPMAAQTHPMKWISKAALSTMVLEKISDERIWHAQDTSPAVSKLISLSLCLCLSLSLSLSLSVSLFLSPSLCTLYSTRISLLS